MRGAPLVAPGYWPGERLGGVWYRCAPTQRTAGRDAFRHSARDFYDLLEEPLALGGSGDAATDLRCGVAAVAAAPGRHIAGAPEQWTRLRSTAIRHQRTGAGELNDEYLVIRNESTRAPSLAGYAVTSRTGGQRPDGGDTLPNRISAEGRGPGGRTCGPGELVVARSGEGRDRYSPKTASQPGQFRFAMGRGRDR